MKSQQVLAVAEEAVSALLNLRWRRVSKTNSGSRQNIIRQIQVFEFYKESGAKACTVEFENYEIDDCLYGRKGKIMNSDGIVIIEDRGSTDVNGKPKEHPLNDLYDMLWDKESGEPTTRPGKFPETTAIENFIDSLR